AKSWADTVPGYERGLKAVIAERGAVPLWQKRCFYGWLKVRESMSISWRRPWYNIQENMNNSRHVPKWKQEAQRLERNARRLEIATVGVEQPHKWLTFLNPKVIRRQRR
ncbi:MAG: hypothetical protein ACREQ3_25865, partial [Candidatus Binatia bacterium]